MDLGWNVTGWAQLTVTTGDRREFIRQLILEQASKHGLDLKSLAHHLGLALFYERGRNGDFAPFGETKAATIITFIGLIGNKNSTTFLETILSATIFQAETRHKYNFSGYFSGVLHTNEIGWTLGQIGGSQSIEILKRGMKAIKAMGWDFPYSFLVGLCLLSDKNAIDDLKKKLEPANVQERCLRAIEDAYYFPAFLIPPLNEIVKTTKDYYVGEMAKQIIVKCTALADYN